MGLQRLCAHLVVGEDDLQVAQLNWWCVMPALAHVAVQAGKNPLALGRRKPLDVLGETRDEEVTMQRQPANRFAVLWRTSLPQNGDTACHRAFLFVIGKYLALVILRLHRDKQ